MLSPSATVTTAFFFAGLRPVSNPAFVLRCLTFEGIVKVFTSSTYIP